MACLENIISYRSNCRGVKSTSGFYLEDIGITPKECGLYINDDYKSGDELIEDKIGFAIKTIKDSVLNNVSSFFTVKSVLANKTLGFYQDNLQLKPGMAGILGGIRIRVNQTNPYLIAFISTVSLQLSSAGNVNVLVYDLLTGVLLDTIPVTTIANQVVTVNVNKEYSGTNRRVDLAIVYDTEGLNSNTTLLSESGCQHCNGYRYSNSFIDAYPMRMDESFDKLANSAISDQHTYGLSVNYSLQCSIENWICELSNKMALPILYKTGELIMEYATLYSKRQNSETTVDMERNVLRKDQYRASYNKALQDVLSGIKPENHLCFKCNENHKTAIVLP